MIITTLLCSAAIFASDTYYETLEKYGVKEPRTPFKDMTNAGPPLQDFGGMATSLEEKYAQLNPGADVSKGTCLRLFAPLLEIYPDMHEKVVKSIKNESTAEKDAILYLYEKGHDDIVDQYVEYKNSPKGKCVQLNLGGDIPGRECLRLLKLVLQKDPAGTELMEKKFNRLEPTGLISERAIISWLYKIKADHMVDEYMRYRNHHLKESPKLRQNVTLLSDMGADEVPNARLSELARAVMTRRASLALGNKSRELDDKINRLGNPY